MNFTHDNHLKYYVGDRLFGDRQYPHEKFVVKVGKVDKEQYAKSNYIEELYRVANLVVTDIGKDVNVMFSGGTDSEMVLRSLKHVGVNPNVFFIRFTNNYNDTDYREATKIIDDLGLKLNVIDFDVIDFYKSGQALEFATQLQCRQIAYLVVYYNILKLSGPAIMGGELMFQRLPNIYGSKWHYTFRENEDGSAMRFSLKYNIPLVYEWFSYTPEMMAYYLENPKIQSLFNTKYNYKFNSYTSKNEILREYMPEIVCSVKLTGYENLMGFNQDAYLTLYQGNQVRYEPSLDGIYIDDITKQLFD